MKAFVILITTASLAALGWWLGTADPIESSRFGEPTLTADPPTKTVVDAEEVFRRAFWREPTTADRILHAERREWASAEDADVRRWQWFLAIEPSPEFTTWLKEANPFTLGKVNSVSLENAPTWFPSAQALTELEIQQSPDHGLTLLFDPKANRLYATDGGKGFTTANKSAPPKPVFASGPRPTQAPSRR